MSRRRIALTMLAVLLIAGGAVGGYLFGASRAPDEADAAEARQQAELIASIQARAEAMPAGLNRGFQVGLAAGQTDGQENGIAEGGSAGQLAASREVDTVLVKDQGGGGGGGNAGLGLGSAPPGQLPGTGGVLVVGDSLEVLTGPYLEQYLKGIPLTHNAVGGYNSYQIFDLFKESFDPSQSVIVFDAGTNDNPNYPEILAGNLQAVSKLVGDRCMVVPTIHGLIVDGVGNEGKNQVVLEFAASRPGTQTPDWAGAVQQHPELMQADDLHPIAEGADLRAQLIAEGVRACLSGSSF